MTTSLVDKLLWLLCFLLLILQGLKLWSSQWICSWLCRILGHVRSRGILSLVLWLQIQWREYRLIRNSEQGWWIPSADGSGTQVCFWEDACNRLRGPIQGERAVAFPRARDTSIYNWWVLWHGTLWVEEGWHLGWGPKGACESDDRRSGAFWGRGSSGCQVLQVRKPSLAERICFCFLFSW